MVHLVRVLERARGREEREDKIILNLEIVLAMELEMKIILKVNMMKDLDPEKEKVAKEENQMD